MTSHRRPNVLATRRRRFVGFVFALTLGAALALAPGAVSPAGAHAPDANQTVPIPASGGTQTRTFSGTVPVQANPTSDCTSIHAASDDHHFNFTGSVPAGTTVTATFAITWTPTSPAGVATNDLILTIVRPSGQSQSSDGGSASETVNLIGVTPGLYHALVCGFANTTPQPYSGTLTVKTTSLAAAEPPLAAAPANGLEFSAAVQADNQRDEAEPLIEINKAGLIYTCGPTGFSNASDYAQMSTDAGEQFHLLGTPPRGQQAGGGGGDCGMAHGHFRNSLGNYQYAYTGLGPLTGFTTSTSPNNGHNLYSAGPDENGLPGATIGQPVEPGFAVDRQWNVFIDHTKSANAAACAGTASSPANSRGCVLMSYNRLLPRHTVVQHSVNGGFTYSPTVRNAATDTDFPGPLRYDAPRNIVAFPWSYDGNKVRLSISKDGGVNWTNCQAAVAPGQIPPFVIGDFDSAGNFYIVYSEKAKFHVYMVAITAANISKCNLPVASTAAVNPGFTQPVQVDRGNLKTAVFPWVTAGGVAGRVAVAFAGTTTEGDPAFGCPEGTTPATRTTEFCAAWDIYVNQSVNALSSNATFSQVKATTHPFHYDSICLNGLACDLSVPPGDRSMADFFSIDLNPVSRKLHVTFNRTEKKPGEDFGHVAIPMVFSQIGGPSNNGPALTRDASRQALRTFGFDSGGDALSNFSLLEPRPPTLLDPIAGVPPTENERGSDFLYVRVAPQYQLTPPYPPVTTNAGFTVYAGIENLTSTALRNTLTRTGSRSLLWVFRFVQGWQVAAAVAHYYPELDDPLDGTPADGFRFGFNNFRTGITPCLGGINPAGIDPFVTSEKCIVYPADDPAVIPGRVSLNRENEHGVIFMSVPRNLLQGLGPNDAFGRPTEVAATTGTRFYDAVFWSLGNNQVTAPGQQTAQSFLYPLDNTRAFDFTLGSGTRPSATQPLDPLVALRKTGPATAKRGATITYTMTYTNVGPNAASNSRITDRLPDELSFVSATGGSSRSYTATNRTVTWNLGTVPAGATTTVTLTAKVASTAAIGGAIRNQANFTADQTVSPPIGVWTTFVVP